MQGTKLDFSPNQSKDPLDHSLAETQATSPSKPDPPALMQPTSSSHLVSDFDLDSIPRSASYTQLPAIRPDTSFERNGVRRTFSENLFAEPKTNTFRHASIKKGSKWRNDLNDQKGQDRLLRSLSNHAKSGPTITISGFQLGPDDDETEIAYRPTSKNTIRAAGFEVKPKSVSGSLARLKRQSWIASSRSPSPNNRKLIEQRPSTAEGEIYSSPTSSPLTVSAGFANVSSTPHRHSPVATEQHDFERQRSRRPISSYLSMTSLSDASHKVPGIPKSFSTDRLPLSRTHTSSEKPPRLPDSKSFERLNAMGTESPRRKDELWSAFRSLDADFQKYVKFIHQEAECL